MQADFKSQYMETKFEYDSACQAVKLAKQSGLREDLMKSLMLAKESLKTTHLEQNTRLLKMIPFNTNFVELGGGWFGVAYTDKRAQNIVIAPIIDKNLYVIERDPRRVRHLSKQEIDTLLPGITDEVTLELYKHRLESAAIEVVREATGSEAEFDGIGNSVTPVGMKVSVHARERWAQRMLGLTMKQAEEYGRTNAKQIDTTILTAFYDADMVWSGADGVEYWFDGDNIVYVYSSNTIITLYEEDFGFSKPINRSIVLGQVKVLKDCNETLTQAEAECAKALKTIDVQVQDIDNQMEVLRAELDLLGARKYGLASDRDEQIKIVRVERERFNAEFNKLFKKWEG